MPTFLVSAPGGEVFTVNAPEGATESDAIQYIKRQYGGARPQIPQIDESQFDTGPSSDEMLQSIIKNTPQDTSLGTLVSDAWERGKGELGISLGPKLMGFLGSTVGADEYAKQQLEQAAQQSAQLEKERPTQLGSYEDVKSVPEAGRFLLEQGVQQVPKYAPSIGMGLAGAAVGGPLGAVAGALLGSFAMEAPDTLENLYRETGDLHVPTAVIAGGMKAALDAVLGVRIAKPIKAAVGAKLLEKSGMEPSLIKTATKELFKDTGIEGVTEGTQQAIDIEAEKIVSKDNKVWTSDDFKSVLNASIVGAASAVGPGVIGGAKSALVESRAAQEREAAAREKEAAEAPVPPPVDEAANRAAEVDALNTQISDLQTQFQAAQDLLNANPKDKRAQYAANQVDTQLKDLLKKQEELSLTPEQLATKRQREEALGEMKLPEDPAEYTGEHMLKLLGMTHKEARKVLDANKIELNLKRPIKGESAEKFTKFLDLVQPTDVSDIARVKDEARRAPAVEDFISRVEQIRDQHPNLQPEAIQRDKVLGIGSNKFGYAFNQILGGRPLTPDTYEAIHADIAARRDEALNYGNTEFAGYLNRKISKSPLLREAALKAQEGPVQEEAPTLPLQEGVPTDELPEAATPSATETQPVAEETPVEPPVEPPVTPPVAGMQPPAPEMPTPDTDLAAAAPMPEAPVETATEAQPVAEEAPAEEVPVELPAPPVAEEEPAQPLAEAATPSATEVEPVAEEPTPAVPPAPLEIQEAKNYLAAIDQGGVPFAPIKLNRILNNLGLETARTETPEQKVQRVRDAVTRYEESVAPATEPQPVAPTQPAAPSPQRTIIEQPTPRTRLDQEKTPAQHEFSQAVRQYAVAPDQTTAKRAYQGVFNVLDGTIRNTLEWKGTPEAVKKVITSVSNLPGATKRFIYFTATLDRMADMAATYNKTAATEIRNLDRLLAERHTEALKRVQQVSQIMLDNTEKMKKFSPEVISKFEEVVHELSRLEIDPDDKSNANHPLYKQFHAFGKDLKDVFYDVTKKYEQDADEFLDSFEKLTDGAFTSTMKAKYKLMRKRIHPFLPLYREGPYWMGYTDASGEPVIRSFNSEIERKFAMQDTVKTGISENQISFFKQLEDITPEKMRPTREMASLIKVMEEKGVPKEVRDKAYQTFLQMFPAGSVMQQFRKRQGRKGYRPQILQNFAVVGSRMADGINKFKYSRDINETYSKIEESLLGEHERSGQDNAIDILNELRKREAYMRNPSNNYYANLASSASYNQYLLGNVSSSMMNTTSLVMSTLPTLGGKYGYPETMNAMSKSLSMYWKGGRDNNTTAKSVFTGRSLADKSFMGDKMRAKAEKAPVGSELHNLLRLYDAGIASQAIHQSTTIDISKDVPATEYTGSWAKIKSSLSWLFQNSERMNREITLLSAFNLELARLKKEENVTGNDAVERAIQEAIITVKRTQGEATSETGARAFQSNIGKVIGTFKKYPMTQLYLIGGMFKEAFAGADAKTKKIAARQLAGIFGIGFAFTGIKGLPLVGGFSFLASMLFGDEDEPFDPDMRATEIFGQMGWNGLMNSFTGLRISDRAAIGQFFREDPKRLAELGPVWYSVEQIAGPTASMVKNYIEAYKSWNEGDTWRALERGLPLGAANIIKAVDYGINGVRTKDGAKITEDPSMYNLIMQGFGFQAEDKARAFEINNVESQITKAMEARKTKLLRDLWRYRNNPEKLAEANAAVDHYNNSKYGRRNPINNESRRKSTKQYYIKNIRAEQHGGMDPNEKFAPEFEDYEEAAGGL